MTHFLMARLMCNAMVSAPDHSRFIYLKDKSQKTNPYSQVHSCKRKRCKTEVPVLQKFVLHSIFVHQESFSKILASKGNYEPRHDKNQHNKSAPSEDSDQPGHPPSLIRVFALRMKKVCVLSYPLSAQRRLIRLGGCPG